MKLTFACRLGSRGGAAELKAHPFFAGLDWDRLGELRAPNIPEIQDELDTRNFEDFEEEEGAASGGTRRTKRTDPEFMCFTYKNMQARRPTVLASCCSLAMSPSRL
jgi:serine/threonine kinase 38